MMPFSLLTAALLAAGQASAAHEAIVPDHADTLAVAAHRFDNGLSRTVQDSLVFRLTPAVAASGRRFLLTSDTVHRRPRAVEVSDAYELRLRIHRYASYTMIPLFALQSVAGNQLYQADKSGAEKPGWAKPTHVVGATGLAALFTINTVTGAWNLWESRHTESGRTKRWIHSILLLASDAGFTYAGVSAGDAEESQATRDRHRNVSYAAMASALAGYAVMLIGDH